MSNYNTLKATIDANVKQNGNQAITGSIMNSVLNQMVTTLGAGYQYMGVAIPTTNPGTPDAKVCYVAATPGTYTNFKNSSNVALEVADGEVAILKYDTSWSKEVTGAATAAQVTQLGQDVDVLQNDVISLQEPFNVVLTASPSTNFPIMISLRKGKRYFFSFEALDNLNFAVNVNTLGGTTLASFTKASPSAYYTPTSDIEGIKVYCGGSTTTTSLSVTIRQDVTLASVDDKVKVLGDVVSSTKATVVGSAYTHEMWLPTKFSAGKRYTIRIKGSAGLLSYNLLGSVAYIKPTLSTVNLANSVSCISWEGSFVATEEIVGFSITRSASGVVGAGDITIEIDSRIYYTKQQVDALTGAVFHVNAATGSDSNPGTSASPFATMEKALSSGSKDLTIVLHGDTTENINLANYPLVRLRLVGESGKKNRIIRGTHYSSATHYSGDVYYLTLSSFPSGSTFWIYQHDVPDAETIITDAERHALQMGREYRCGSTRIVRAASLDDVVSGSSPSYYWDEANTRLYFKIVSGTSLATNPLVIPTFRDKAIYGNPGSIALEVENIDALYCRFELLRCHGATFKDCAALYAYGEGCFIWDLSIGLELVRCEAARCTFGTSAGDGFNAHSTSDASYSTNNPFAKHTTARLIDCWSHDNNDDGYSDHERCECIVSGGLFEYNKKAGVTPSYGSHMVGYNILSRKNFNGFYFAGAAEVAEGGKYGQMELYECVSMDNTQDAGFNIDGAGNKMRLVSCKSIGDLVGFYVKANTSAVLIDCSTINVTTPKAVAASASCTILNTTLLAHNP